MHDLTTIDSEGQAKTPVSVTTQPASGQHRARAMMRSKSEAAYSKSKSTRSTIHIPVVFFYLGKFNYESITYTLAPTCSQSVPTYVPLLEYVYHASLDYSYIPTLVV